MVSLQRLSSKINYDVLEKLFDDSVSLFFFLGFQFFEVVPFQFSLLLVHEQTHFLFLSFKVRINNSENLLRILIH